MRVHEIEMKTGIRRTPEFEKKDLASFAVNVGAKCGHDCLYCSTGAVCRMLPVFKAVGENPFGFDYALVDPNTPDRVAADARRIKKRGLVQLATLTDAWAPEAQKYNLGRRCLEAILAQPGWTVRILTKNAAVVQDYDLIEQYRDRVRVGLSLTAPPENEHLMAILEPNASPIRQRMAALKEARRRGLRTYLMLCPLLPGIADSPSQIDTLVKFAADCRAEEIFVEPVNARGPGLKNCQAALEKADYFTEAKAIEHVRNQTHWSRYVRNLLRHIQVSVAVFAGEGKLRFLLYGANLRAEDRRAIYDENAGVRWLGKDMPF